MRRLTPDSMGARLVLTGILLAVAVATATIVIDMWLVSSQVDSWTRSDLASTFRGFHSLLTLEADSLTSSVNGIATAAPFRQLMAKSDREGLASQFGGVFRTGAVGYAIAAIDTSGSVLVSSGSRTDVQTLARLAVAHPSVDTTGFVRMDHTPAIVYGCPVKNPAGTAIVGYLIAEREFGEIEAARFSTTMSTIAVAIRPATYRPASVALTTQHVGDQVFASGTQSDTVVAIEDMPSVDGGSAGVIELTYNDPQALRTTSIAAISAVLSGVVALVIGVLLGIWLTRVMRRPVLRMVERVRAQAALAAEGAPCSPLELAHDESLPIEFRELGGVMEELLQHLSARQIELENAIRDAAYAEESLNVVVAESPEVKLVLQSGRIIIANPAAALAFGLPASQLTDLTVDEAMAGVEIRDEEGARYDAEALLERALIEPVAVSITERGRLEHWYVVQAVKHADDMHDRILFTARDVTEERRLAVIRAEIVSIIGHDLRSPLTVVIGYLDLLTRPMTDEQRAGAIETARRNAGRMSDLLEDLLTATRAEELLAPSELVPTRLTDLAEEVVASMAPTHAERKLLLDSDCDPVVLGEEKRLRQVLVNLVTNAFKYSPDTDPVLVRVRCDDTNAYLEVVDHGPGIPEDDRAHVFERFARLANTAGRPGLGLGLYIVSIIAHNHGGEALVSETPGGGATFTVRLPQAGNVVDGEVRLLAPEDVTG
jgi:signal transduction histidine kinase